jgi:hypothetical protein
MAMTNSDYDKIRNAIQVDPDLGACFLARIDTVDHSDNWVKTGDDAEEAVVDVIKKMGQTLLEKWAARKRLEAEAAADLDPTMWAHEKKRLLENLCGRYPILGTRLSDREKTRPAESSIAPR